MLDLNTLEYLISSEVFKEMHFGFSNRYSYLDDRIGKYDAEMNIYTELKEKGWNPDKPKGMRPFCNLMFLKVGTKKFSNSVKRALKKFKDKDAYKIDYLPSTFFEDTVSTDWNPELYDFICSTLLLNRVEKSNPFKLIVDDPDFEGVGFLKVESKEKKEIRNSRGLIYKPRYSLSILYAERKI